MKLILALAVALLVISSVGIWFAVLMEYRAREPKYLLMMKIFPWFFGIGAVLLGIAISLR